MSEGEGSDAPLDAGELRSWVAEIRSAIRGDVDADVPCGTCTACCTASQFVHVGPDEAEALAHIPRELLFPAPGLPRGHVLMGYDEHGRCPMLGDAGCSIYEHRPRTCRTYDCRVFAATGVDVAAGDPTKRGIATRAARWRFDVGDDRAEALDRALRAAASFIETHPEALPGPADATRRAVLAVQIADLFLAGDDPDPAAVRAAILQR
jgi:hypothetical protein